MNTSQKQSNIRTRFAPSPTGYIHIGNLRSAIFPYLLAKQKGGTFILRIEDTDQNRFIKGATELIIETLDWLGIDADEGVMMKDKKLYEAGDYGPYTQTERKDIYIEWAKKLIAKGRAYADPYTSEELQAFREADQKNKRAFLYRNYRPLVPPEWKLGMPLRFKQTDLKDWQWHDEVMGDLSAGKEALDDFILIKSDGLPTYNFAHIIDDYTMKCSYVTRGVEYISSTPNYLSLYEALEIERPKLVSLPHIMAPSGNKKLGKRDGAKSAIEYRDDGILPEAMLNFLACLGWNDGTEQEIFSKQELIEKFSLDRISRSGARFDEAKLIWLNGQWIRILTPSDLEKRVEKFWGEEAFDPAISEGYRRKVLALVQDRLKTLSDLPMLSSYFFKDPEINLDMIFHDKKLKTYSENQLANLLQAAVAKLGALNDWDPSKIQDALNELLTETSEKPMVLFSLIRLAVSFAPFSPALNDTLALLGRDRTLFRLNQTATAIEND